MEHEEDLKQTIDCVKIARNILAQNSMTPYAGKEIGPGNESQSDKFIEEYILIYILKIINENRSIYF